MASTEKGKKKQDIIWALQAGGEMEVEQIAQAANIPANEVAMYLEELVQSGFEVHAREVWFLA